MWHNARELMLMYNKENDEMLQRIVAIFEILIRPFEPELKHQSNEWHTKNSRRPPKFRRSKNCAKMLMILFFFFFFFLRTISVEYWQHIGYQTVRLWIKSTIKMYIRTIQSILVISTSLISNNRIYRSENLVPVLTLRSTNRQKNIVEKRRNCPFGAISPLFHNIFDISVT